MPLIDVIIPAYNAESTIASAIASMQAQTLSDLRLIVVNDGSTDATGSMLERMARDDRRIVVIHTENRGIVDALNEALAASLAPYIARHDADDLAFPDRLERQLSFLEAHPECVAIGANAFHIDQHGTRTGVTTSFKAVVAGDPSYVPSLEPYLMHPFLLVRRQALIDVGGYRYVFHSEDCDLYWRLAGRGTLTNIVEPLGEYRVHAGSVSAKSIVNGRISAVSSQLAAISERRRRLNQPDLVFDKGRLADYQERRELAAMLALAATGLTEAETHYLEVSAAAKLLELSTYRPYRMTPLDLSTIRQSIERHYLLMAPRNRRQIVFHDILGKRLRSRSAPEALRLIPWKVMPLALWDVMTRLKGKLLGRPEASPA